VELGHRLSRWLRLRFFLILLLLAGVSIAAYSVFNALVSGQEEGGELLIQSGRQHLLVQRIATNALRYEYAPLDEQASLRNLLRDDAQQLVTVQRSLNYEVAGSSARKQAEEILYSDPHHLIRNIQDLDGLVTALVQLPNDMSSERHRLAKQIGALSDGSLGQAQEALQSILANGLGHRVRDLHVFAVVGEILFIGLLLVMARIVFRPLLRHTNETMFQLASLERYHRSVVDSLADGILVLDPEHRRIESLNPSARDIFHLDEAKAHGLPLDSLIPTSAHQSLPQLRRWLRREVLGCGGEGESFHLEVTIRETAIDGFDRLIAVVRDVTKQVEAEERVQTLNHALEQSGASVLITDTDGVIIYANPQTTAITGYSRDELVGQTPRILQSGMTPASVYADMWGTVKSGQAWRGEMLNRRKNGELYWESLVISPLRNATGQITQFIAVTEEITDRKMMEDALVVAKQQAERASRSKSDFLASMSHELRTPLNAIIGYSEFMGCEPFGPLGDSKYNEYLGHIHESGRHLLELINDMLDLSKVEAGKLPLEEEEIDLERSLQVALHLVDERASRRNVTVSPFIPVGLPRLYADNLRLKQIVLNLLTNAIKFTPEGGEVSLKVEIEERTGWLSLMVTDTGVGISPEDIERVLEPFSQVANPMVSREEGTGLGLPITKRLVELHGGTLHLDSVLGKGTRATVRLPPSRLLT